MTITIHGPPRTKKNSQRIVVLPNGRRSIMPSAAYKEYERDALRQLVPKPRKPIDVPVNVQCVYYMPTHRRVDLVNLQECSLDILVKGGVLADDNSNIVASMDGSRVLYDKENSRVEITITGV